MNRSAQRGQLAREPCRYDHCSRPVHAASRSIQKEKKIRRPHIGRLSTTLNQQRKRPTITRLYSFLATNCVQRSTTPLVQSIPGSGCRVPETIAIAVIDDDDSFRVALAESLTTFGFEVRGYASAEDFISENGQKLCNLAVTDVHMPGMSGLDLARRVAASDRKIPIILITARSEANMEARALAAGASRFLKKPFGIGELIKCIEGALGT
jgi:CheY-like chemotaxis protein